MPPADWPHRAASRALPQGGIDWHVQVAGTGPVLLLLHGSGASTHSWAALLPLLTPHATVVMPDLPGHGFTAGATPDDLKLPRMRARLAALLQALALPAPTVVAGHSAGAALALRWAVDAPVPPRAVIGFAPSLVAPPARYMQWLAPLVHPVATSAPVAQLLAKLAGATRAIDRLLDSTGSVLPPAQKALYRRLFADPAHVRGAMSFMAAADLPALLPACAAVAGRAAFVLGDRDHWVPEPPLRAVLSRHFPAAEVQRWRGGHLVHEEEPQRAACFLLDRLG